MDLAVSPPAKKLPALVIRNAPDRDAAARYLKAAARALGRQVEAGDTTRAVPKDARHLAWLSPGPVPSTVLQWVRAGGVLMIDHEARIEGLMPGTPRWRDRQGRVLARESSQGRGRVIAMQFPLSAQSVPELLQGGFPDQLEALLDPLPKAPARAEAAVARPLAGGPGYQVLPEPMDDWLVWLAVTLLLVERWMATRANRELAA